MFLADTEFEDSRLNIHHHVGHQPNGGGEHRLGAPHEAKIDLQLHLMILTSNSHKKFEEKSIFTVC